MIENLKLPKELLNTPFKDWEHPSLRFDIKVIGNVEQINIVAFFFDSNVLLLINKSSVSFVSLTIDNITSFFKKKSDFDGIYLFPKSLKVSLAFISCPVALILFCNRTFNIG